MLMPLIGLANDYTFIDILKDDVYKSCKESMSVSVVIPTYNSNDILKKCINMLTMQTFGAHRIEIIIADDGSEVSPSFLIKDFINIFKSMKIISQDDIGFRLSEIRNKGIIASSEDYIILLDCDVIPSIFLVEEHMKALSVSSNVISVGFRTDNYDPEGDFFIKIEKEKLDWRYNHFVSLGDDWLKYSNAQYKIASGGNVASHKSLFLDNLFDETFLNWGGEDNEWAYRCVNNGAYIYPNLSANGFHIRKTTAHTSDQELREKALNRVMKKCPSYSHKSIYLEDFDVPYCTIWITFYKKYDYLEDAIKSISGLEVSHEILIIDNECSEQSINLINSLCAQYKNTRSVREPNQGVYHAYQKALKESKGEILVQLDADDFIVKNELKDLLDKSYYSCLGLLYGLTEKCDSDLKALDHGVWIPQKISRHSKLLEGMYIRNPRLARKRDLSRTPPRTFKNASVDFDLYSKMHLITDSIQIDEIAYKHRLLKDSISNSIFSEQNDNSLNIISENIELLKGTFDFICEIISERSTKIDFKNGYAYFYDHLKLTTIAELILINEVSKNGLSSKLFNR